MEEYKLVPVYTIKKMMELVKLGFVVMKVVDNKYHPQYKVFLFKEENGIGEYLTD